MAVDVNDLKSRVDTHEAVCAQRYISIDEKLKRLEAWFIALFTAMVGLLITIILKLII